MKSRVRKSRCRVYKGGQPICTPAVSLPVAQHWSFFTNTARNIIDRTVNIYCSGITSRHRRAVYTMRMLFVNVLPLVGAALVANSPGTATRYTFAAPYDQSFLEGYSILKHVGGLGPYSNRVANGVGRDPPDGCAVDQVIMLRRHGERYPQAKNGPPIKGTLAKMRTSNTTYTGDLSFFPGWNFYIPDDGLYEMETESGPYNGLLTSYKHGAEYKVRYGHLWNASSSDPIPVWTGEFERVVQTARKFGMQLSPDDGVTNGFSRRRVLWMELYQRCRSQPHPRN